MMDEDNSFSMVLQLWYSQHGRDLPWRHTKDAYLIWVSEIIMQQTQVVQGLDYYLRFVERFPNVESLAAAEEDDVMRLWQGLGYYSRARNMQRAARQVVDMKCFPRNYEAIRSLCGVGDYTAAAIASFAFDLPYAVVDGNVYRVLSRYFGIDTPIDTSAGKKAFASLAQHLLDETHPAMHNQAIMDFGALVCTPRSAGCHDCPLACSCVAFASGMVDSLPVKSHSIKVRHRYLIYIYTRFGDKLIIHKRGKDDIWAGLYEFPLIEVDAFENSDANRKKKQSEKSLGGKRESKLSADGISDDAISEALISTPWVNEALTDGGVLREVCRDFHHQLSHQLLHAYFCILECKSRPTCEGVVIDADGLGDYAKPRMLELLIEKMDKQAL